MHAEKSISIEDINDSDAEEDDISEDGGLQSCDTSIKDWVIGLDW